MAADQHGVVTRGDLMGLGFSSESIKHRLQAGRLHRVSRGVYAAGSPRLSREGRWMAAALACGEGAVLSHRSAAALWGIGTERRGQIDISVRRRCEIQRPGICARSRPSLPARDVHNHRRIPVTTPVCTLIDLATELGDRRLERAVNETDKRDLVDPETLRAAIEEHAGQPGAPRLRRLLDRDTFRLSDSDLELFFRPIAEQAGLRRPSPNNGSTASKSISTGPTSTSSSRPTASATTAPHLLSPAMLGVTRSIPPPA